MKTILAISILVLAVGSGCGPIITTAGWKNQDINYAIRSDIKELNAKFIESINNNDLKSYNDLLSDSLKQLKNVDVEGFFKKYRGEVKGKSVSIFKEYYWKISNPGLVLGVVDGENENAFKLNVVPMNKKTYMSLLLLSDSITADMLTLVYGNYGGKWKVNILQMNSYSFKNETAQDFYRHAQKLYREGDIVDAFLIMGLCNTCLNPCGPNLVYNNYSKISELQEKLKKQLFSAYAFPYTINNIKSKPRIFKIEYTRENNGFYLTILYQTSINLSDKDNLKKEYNEIHNAVLGMFSGVEKNNDLIIYRAYNQFPVNENPFTWNQYHQFRKSKNG